MLNKKEEKYAKLFIRFMKENNAYGQYFKHFKKHGTFEKVINLCVMNVYHPSVFKNFNVNGHTLSTPFNISYKYKGFSNEEALGDYYDRASLRKKFVQYLIENYK